MVVIFAHIPMFAWEANIGMLAPGGYIRKIRSLVDCDSSYEPDEIDEIKNQTNPTICDIANWNITMIKR